MIEIEASYRDHNDTDKKRPDFKFDAEVMSIIGSINKKNQEIRSKFSSLSNKDQPVGFGSEQATIIPKGTQLDTIQTEDEVLKNMVMDLNM